MLPLPTRLFSGLQMAATLPTDKIENMQVITKKVKRKVVENSIFYKTVHRSVYKFYFIFIEKKLSEFFWDFKA